MTRINCVPPAKLVDKHLLAEYRELPRVFTLAYAAHDKKPFEQYVPIYTMGKGHVIFFYDKLKYLVNRHISLCDEMELRGIQTNLRNVANEWIAKAEPYYAVLWNDWQPNIVDIQVNRNRLNERLKDMKFRKMVEPI